MGVGVHLRRDEQGFSLIELLVVIVILAILASIALPIYLNQRERAYITSVQTTLKNTAVFVDAYAVKQGGNYSGLDDQSANIADLQEEGYKHPDWANNPGYIQIEATMSRYCIEARHRELSPMNTWREATFDSENPRPVESPNTCPDLE